LAVVPHSTVENFHTYDVSPDGERFIIPAPRRDSLLGRSGMPHSRH
jgi:hypothetical protein